MGLIAIVDDNDARRRRLHDAVSALGHDTVSAASAADITTGGSHPDVVMVQVLGRDAHGVDIVDGLGDDLRSAAAVFLVGPDAKPAFERLPAGSTVLRQPFTTAELAAALRTVTG